MGKEIGTKSGHLIFKWYSIASLIWIPIFFITNKSLWVDEFLLALNFQDHNWTHLLQPLDHHQMAPIGFLLACKIFAVIFSNQDFAFKIIPAFGWILSWFLLKKTMEHYKISNIFMWGGLALFSSNTLLLEYAYEFKQYSTDSASCLLIYYLYLVTQAKNDYGSWFKFGIASALCILFSNVAIVVLTAIGVINLVNNGISFFRSRLFQTLVTLLIFFALYFTLFLFQHPSEEYMLQYWSNKNAFFPSPNMFVFLWHKFQIILEIIFNHKLIGIIFLLLMAISVSFHQRIDLLSIQNIFVLLLIIHLLLSTCNKYPFENRFLLYTIPFAILLLMYYFNQLNQSCNLLGNRRKIFLNLHVMAIALCISFGLLLNVAEATQPKEDLKTAMKQLENDASDIDQIWVSEGAEVGYLYYKHFFPLINSIPYKLSKNCNSESFFVPERPKVAFVLSHFSPYDTKEKDVENLIKNQVTQFGYDIHRTIETKRSLILIAH